MKKYPQPAFKKKKKREGVRINLLFSFNFQVFRKGRGVYILLKEFQSKGESTILWGSFLRGSRGAAGGGGPLLIQISLKLHNKITKNLPQTLWQTQITVGPHPQENFSGSSHVEGKI